MKKVRLRNAEYMASLPPYRFQPGDVIEVDNDWADDLVRKNIARMASKDAETVVDKRRAMRAEQEAAQSIISADQRAAERAALLAKLSDLDTADQRAAEIEAPYGGHYEGRPSGPEQGHYGDMITREGMGSPADDANADDKDKPRRRQTATATTGDAH